MDLGRVWKLLGEEKLLGVEEQEAEKDYLLKILIIRPKKFSIKLL